MVQLNIACNFNSIQRSVNIKFRYNIIQRPDDHQIIKPILLQLITFNNGWLCGVDGQLRSSGFKCYLDNYKLPNLGWGLLKLCSLIPTLLIFWHYKICSILITVVFGRCHRSWAAAKPVKDERDILWLTINWKIRTITERIKFIS